TLGVWCLSPDSESFVPRLLDLSPRGRVTSVMTPNERDHYTHVVLTRDDWSSLREHLSELKKTVKALDFPGSHVSNHAHKHARHVYTHTCTHTDANL
ncbi:MAG: hypothetical protein ACK55Z_05415, partial [bacterium]